MSSNSASVAVTMPDYMSAFHCIGPDCEDTCCAGHWNIPIDRPTYEKNQAITDPKLRERAIGCMQPVINDPIIAARIPLAATGGTCPLFDPDRLCAIHKTCGIGHLSDTCTFYPRVINVIGGSVEMSGSLSCPEVARHLLAATNGFELNTHNLDWLATFGRTRLPAENAVNLPLLDSLSPHVWNIRAFALATVRDRQYSLPHRLIILGLFCKALDDAWSRDATGDIPEIIDRYKTMMHNQSLTEQLDTMPKDTAVQLSILSAILDDYLSRGMTSTSYRQCVTEFIEGLGQKTDPTVEGMTQRYTEAHQGVYASFMRERPHILENLLQNDFVRHVVPFTKTPADDSTTPFFDAYIPFIIRFALMRTHLVGMAAYHKGLDEALVVRVAYTFSRMIEHDNAFVPGVFQILEQNEARTMGHMAVMVSE